MGADREDPRCQLLPGGVWRGGSELLAAKRRALLAPGEDFFGHAAVLARLAEPLRALYRERTAGTARVLVYGELFGGAYPHPDVAAVPGVQAIQTGIWYCPEVDFLAFDVVEEAEDGARRRWLAWDELVGRCTVAGMPFVPARFIGSYTEARQQPVAFATEVPARRGLPPLDDNLAEGFVLKPRRPLELDGQRPVLKHKHPRFAEDARYHQAERWPERPGGAPDAAPLAVLEWAILSRLTPPRRDAARSKLGPHATAAALCEEVFSDVWGELGEAHPLPLAQLSAEERLLLQSVLRQEARALIGQEP